jgi:glycosyltransferase involved in cell wall biosynthesis
MPINSLKPCYEPDKYLAFLGRISPEKGPEAAIRLAKAAGRPLRIAAKIPRAENQYFREEIEPLIDGNDVEFVGEVNEAEKQDFLGKAAGLLFPISWPEPFGLVMIEAMACGTPVIANRYGSVPEVVNDGVSGFVVGSEQEALAAIQRIASVDRRGVRAEFERRFTSRRMAEDYQRLYTKLVHEPKTRTPRAIATNARSGELELTPQRTDGGAKLWSPQRPIRVRPTAKPYTCRRARP